MRRLFLAIGLLMPACDSETAAPPQSKEVPTARIETPRPQDPPAPQNPPARPPPFREDLFPKKPEYVVKPVEGEPAWPSPSQEKAVADRGFVPFKGGYLYELTDADGKVSQSGAVVDGQILLNRGVVELLGCGTGGKEYESVLRLEGDVQGLDLALSLCGLKRGPIPQQLADPGVIQGSRVLVLLQWADDQGRIVTHRAEDCVVNLHRQSPMPRVGWTYVGAMLPVPDPAATGGKTYRVLAASGTRSLMTTYRDPTTLLDNPLFDAIDDSLYMANYMILPPSQTKIRVILRAPDEAERKEIAKIEEELVK